MTNQNCATCAYATKKQHQEPCRECYEQDSDENHFPMWAPKQ